MEDNMRGIGQREGETDQEYYSRGMSKNFETKPYAQIQAEAEMMIAQEKALSWRGKAPGQKYYDGQGHLCCKGCGYWTSNGVTWYADTAGNRISEGKCGCLYG